jgi:outer membrane lipoprotein-sorting protein
MLVNRFSIVLVVSFLSFFSLGAGETPAIQSIRADFVQKKYLPILSKPLISKGALYFESPRSLRWEYLSPVRSILLMTEGRVRRHVADTESGFREERGGGLDAMQVILEDIGEWLSGRFDKNPLFTAVREEGGRILLTPREEGLGSVIQKIELHLSEIPGVIEKVVIFESASSYTELIFFNTVLNREIDPRVFRSVP